MPQDKPIAIAFIGFGEVGQRFSADLMATKRLSSRPMTSSSTIPPARPSGWPRPMSSALSQRRTPLRRAGAAMVISAVTADAAKPSPGRRGISPARPDLLRHQLGVAGDQARAGACVAAGADYVEGAVMAPVPGPGIAVPILGRRARSCGDGGALLNALGMNVTPVATETAAPRQSSCAAASSSRGWRR